jgi:hypothetical protein
MELTRWTTRPLFATFSYEKTENGRAATNALLTGSCNSARLVFWPDVNRSYDATDQMAAVRHGGQGGKPQSRS